MQCSYCNIAQEAKSYKILCLHKSKKQATSFISVLELKSFFEVIFYDFYFQVKINERKSEQAHIPHAPTLLENAVYNEWQFQALPVVTGNRTKKGI